VSIDIAKCNHRLLTHNLISLHATSIPYHANISKKKRSADPYPADGANGNEEVFVGEALGLVMISHGQDMIQTGVSDRQYAERLEKFGRARCKIAMVSCYIIAV
jgi:hypothetical protein